jgi:hypothetical protein
MCRKKTYIERLVLAMVSVSIENLGKYLPEIRGYY